MCISGKIQNQIIITNYIAKNPNPFLKKLKCTLKQARQYANGVSKTDLLRNPENNTNI